MTEFLFQLVKKFWKWILMMAAQYCKCTQCYWIVPKNGYNVKFYITYILPQLREKNSRGAWVVYLVKHPTLAQVMTSRFGSSSPTLSSVPSAQVCFGSSVFLLKTIIYIWEREIKCKWGKDRERETEDPKQAPRYLYRAQRGAQTLDRMTMTWAQIKSWPLNPLSTQVFRIKKIRQTK